MPGFKEMRNNSSLTNSTGSFQIGHIAYKEEETIEQHYEQCMRANPPILSLLVARRKHAFGHGKNNF